MRQRYEIFSHPVPKFFARVQVTLGRAGQHLGQAHAGTPHDEDSHDAGDVLTHLRPLEALLELPPHQVVDVETGTGLEEPLRAVLHLDQDMVARLRRAEEVENHPTPLVRVTGCLHVLEFHTRNLLAVAVEDSVQERFHNRFVLHAELKSEVALQIDVLCHTIIFYVVNKKVEIIFREESFDAKIEN